MYFKFKGEKVTAATLADLSAEYRKRVEENGMGSSNAPFPTVYEDNGKRVGCLSYNGRVWPKSMKNWTPGDLPIYDPYT
jgi:hypothetical protein